MRSFLTGLALLFLCGTALRAQDSLLFRPEGAGEFFFPSHNPVPRSISGGEELALDYGSWSLLLQPGFIPTGRTLVQIFFDSRRQRDLPAGDLAPSRTPAPAGGTEFSRPWRGGTLSYSPLAPDRVVFIKGAKEALPLEERPPGILTFFETGNDVFWLGNGTDFFCYDGRGRRLARHGLDGAALMAAADGEGFLYPVFPDGSVGRLPPREERGAPVREKPLEAWELLSSCYEEARSLIASDFSGYGREFDRWVLERGETLYRGDPLNGELGDFLRSLR